MRTRLRRSGAARRRGAWTYRGAARRAGREHRAPAARADPGRRQLRLPPRRRGLPHRTAARPGPPRRRPAPRRDPAAAGTRRWRRPDGCTRCCGAADEAAVVTERKPPSLTARTVRGFVWAFTGSAGQAVLQIAATIVLARLLTPAGVRLGGRRAARRRARAAADPGGRLGRAGPAPRARPTTTSARRSRSPCSSRWCSPSRWRLGAPVLGPLVGLPADSGLLPLLAPTLLLAGVAAVPSGLLQRRLRFRPLAVVDLDRGRARDDRRERGARARRVRPVRAGVGGGRRRGWSPPSATSRWPAPPSGCSRPPRRWPASGR